jgi:penicillin-binding protein 1A
MNTPSDNASSIRNQRKPKYERIIKNLWRLTILGIIGLIILFVGLSFSGLPTFEELENPKSRDASEIYSSDGKVLGRYYIENRVRVNYEDLSPNLVNALTATEDERFYQHSGIDPEALARAVVNTAILRKSSSGGGSTITQQLAKLLFTGKASRNPFKRLVQKLKEWIVAVKLERSYTKQEIMTMYLNEFDFINGAYGIKSASETYFSTTPDKLTIEEAALLVGMLKNPALYNPRRFPENAKKRREVVLKQMNKNGFITEDEYHIFRKMPLDMTGFSRMTHSEGPAPYFREVLRLELKKTLSKLKKPSGGTYDLYRDGLKIYTTIDSRMQKHAEAAVNEHMSAFQKTFFKHWKGKDPWTYRLKKDSRNYKIRQNGFERLVRSSDRYQTRRSTIMAKAGELELRDVDIERMQRIEKEGWDLMYKWLDEKFIGKKLAKKYQAVLGKDFKGDDWAQVMVEWTKLQRIIKKEFSRKVKMKVYAYNAEGQTDTLMTPYDSIRYHRMFLQTGMCAVDPITGHVKAWVGGVNHKYFQLDHVTTNRQVGSTFKPILYALSMNRGYTPCDKVPDIAHTIEKGTFGIIKDWTPKNASGRYSGAELTLVEALKKSKNSVSAYLMKDIGTTRPVIQLAGNMGIDTDKIPNSPTICLGTSDLSVLEMAGAYTAFANEGIYTKPIYIERIEDKLGNVIWEPDIDQKQVLEKNDYYSMVHLLRGVVRGAPGFGGLKSDVGGKTGTTSNYSDGWFMGVTPNIVASTWVGGDDRWIRYRSLYYGQGGKMARPIFAKFLRKLEKDDKLDFDAKKRFKRPESYSIELDCSLYTDIPDGSFEDEYEDAIQSDSTIIDDPLFNEFN